MTRDLTAGMAAAVAGASLSPIVLVKLEFDAADLNLWTGVGDLTWSGDVYTGAGDLLTASRVTEQGKLVANALRLTLSGLPSSLIALARDADYQDRPGTVWFGALDGAGAVIADPYPVFPGFMDVFQFVDSGESATISCVLEHEAAALGRPNERRYTPEDQALIDPTDTGFDAVKSLQDADFKWGP